MTSRRPLGFQGGNEPQGGPFGAGKTMTRGKDDGSASGSLPQAKGFPSGKGTRWVWSLFFGSFFVVISKKGTAHWEHICPKSGGCQEGAGKLVT